MSNLNKIYQNKNYDNFFLKVILLSELYVLLSLFSPNVNAVYTLLDNMEKFINTQKHVMKNVKKSIPEVQDQSSQRILQNFVNKCEREHSKAITNVRRYIENPINCVTIVTRLSRDLDTVEDILKLKETTNYTKNHKLTYVSELEFREIGRGMVHLIVAYNLNVSDIANGILRGNFNQTKENFVDEVSPMTSADCLDLGHIAVNYGESEIAYAWMKEAVDRYPADCKEKYECPFIKEQLMNSFDQANQRRNKKYKRPSEDFKDFHALCRDEGPKNRNLSCQYRYGPHPFLRLARLKEEILHRAPDVTMFHDVISDDEIEGIKKLTVERKKNSTSNKGYRFTVTTINDSSTAVVAKVSLRVLDMTGLSATFFDGFAVVTYGIAGYYVPYFEPNYKDNDSEIEKNISCSKGLLTYSAKMCEIADSFRDFRIGPILKVIYNHELNITNSVSNGYRHSKIQFFLSDVNQGGATVFDRLGLTVFPVKKSAVIWSTRHRRDGIEQMTEYATCPVLHGTKWVTMEWLSDKEVLDTCKENDPREEVEEEAFNDWVTPIIEDLPIPKGLNIPKMFSFDDMSDNLEGETRDNKRSGCGHFSNQSSAVDTLPDDLPESEDDDPSPPDNKIVPLSYESLLNTLRSIKIQN